MRKTTMLAALAIFGVAGTAQQPDQTQGDGPQHEGRCAEQELSH